MSGLDKSVMVQMQAAAQQAGAHAQAMTNIAIQMCAMSQMVGMCATESRKLRKAAEADVQTSVEFGVESNRRLSLTFSIELGLGPIDVNAAIAQVVLKVVGDLPPRIAKALAEHDGGDDKGLNLVEA